MDKVSRPTRHIAAPGDAMAIYQGQAASHDFPQPDVVSVVRILTSIAISQQATFLEAIVIGSWLSLNNWSGSDTQW